MKYYKLLNSLKTNEIGKFIQCSGALSRGNIGDLGLWKEITEQVNLPELAMDKKSKPTTILSTWINSNKFLVLKKYFIDFLKNFNIGHFNHWSLKIHHKNEVLKDYELFHLSYPTGIKSIIKYKESDFVVLPRGGWDKTTITKPVQLENYENYCNLREILNESEDDLTIAYTKLVLDFSNTTEDLIRFVGTPFNNGYYISERLKKAIEEKRFTGMTFQEIEQMDNKIKAIY